MRLRPRLELAPLLALALVLALAAPATAQSVVSASVRGTVTDDLGAPIPRTVVTLEPLGGGTLQEAITGAGGSFAFPLAAPGTYQLRAEALGYQPLVARTLDLAGGDAVTVPLMLRPATPPVMTVDTVSIETTAGTRTRAGGLRLGGTDIDELPNRFGDLGGVVARSTHFDRSLGSQGLPASMTLLFADGLPAARAPHPTRRSEHLADAMFPRGLVSSVTALHNAGDVEWSGAAGGYGTLATRSGVPGGAAVEGGWSGGPLWSSGELGLDDTPGLTSYQAAGRASVDLKPDTTTLLVASEVLQHEAPQPARIDAETADALSGLGPELALALGAPSVERVSRYSGLGRFYTQPTDASRVLIRGNVVYSERTFDGPGTLPAPAAGLGE
ncbi:MAG: carboxypeptidase-like regulatory domain-containing protein, partial [Dehalococcoidia bacterium]